MYRGIIMKLLLSALTKFFAGLLIVGLLIFLPAGTLNYGGGLLFCAVLFVPIFILGIVLLVRSPKLLEKRLDSKERDASQKGIVMLSALGFLAGFIMAGLDFRFSLSSVPAPVVITAVVVFLLSYVLYAEVMRENEYLSRTVKVEEGQRVVDTALYGIVRHPMYAVTVVMFLMIPLILGSPWSLLIFLHYPILIVCRIINEEKLLTAELEGYSEYKNKVKYRLVPFIW